MSRKRSPNPIASLRALAREPDVARLLADWDSLAHHVESLALKIQAIPAPTFFERERGEFVRAHMARIGLEEVRIDRVGNVWGRSPGQRVDDSPIVLCAHLDTVFDAQTDLTVVRDDGAGRITGPGLGDNSLGVAAMLALAEQIHLRQVPLAAGIWWVATVGEEGLGNLRGMQRVCDELGERVGAVLALEGLGLGRIYYAGLGVLRLRIEVIGPGGHAWLHAARPSAVEHIIRIGAGILAQVRISQAPRTSLNIGLIEGGSTINTRAANASLQLDLRSEDATALDDLERDLRRIVGAVPCPPELSVSIQTIGSRPFGKLDVEHPLVQGAQAALEVLDHGPGSLEIGSTDANVPLAKGIPAICIGLTTGGNAHTLNEYIDTASIPVGMRQLTLLTLFASQHAPDWKSSLCAGEP